MGTQTKTNGQRSGCLHVQAKNIWPSSGLALPKLVHLSQGQLAQVFIGLFRAKCVCVCTCISVCVCNLVVQVLHVTF